MKKYEKQFSEDINRDCGKNNPEEVIWKMNGKAIVRGSIIRNNYWFKLADQQPLNSTRSRGIDVTYWIIPEIENSLMPSLETFDVLGQCINNW